MFSQAVGVDSLSAAAAFETHRSHTKLQGFNPPETDPALRTLKWSLLAQIVKTFQSKSRLQLELNVTLPLGTLKTHNFWNECQSKGV